MGRAHVLRRRFVIIRIQCHVSEFNLRGQRERTNGGTRSDGTETDSVYRSDRERYRSFCTQRTFRNIISVNTPARIV